MAAMCGILAERQNALTIVGVGDVVAAAVGRGDELRILAQTVLIALLLHRPDPGLLDELEEARGARRRRFRLGLEAAFALRGLQEVIVVGSGRELAIDSARATCSGSSARDASAMTRRTFTDARTPTYGASGPCSDLSKINPES
jgi:hypothetical protein